jgi:hypothetical protein
MFRLFKIGKVSFILTLVFVIANTLNVATSGLFESYLSSGSLDFFAGSDYWKAISYLLIQPDVASFFLVLFTFTLISPFLENLLSSKYFAKLTFIFALFQGIAVPLFFFLIKDYSSIISGADGLAIFVLTLFTLLNPGYSVSAGKLNIKTRFLTVTTILTWLAVKTPLLIMGSWSLLLPTLVFAVLGLAAGVVSYFVLREEPKDDMYINFDDIDIIMPKVEELKPALIAKEMKNNKESIDYEHHVEYTNNPREDEENLNTILDKINEFGKDSLTADEMNFLKEYSSHL